jgi:hypothetical protein
LDWVFASFFLQISCAIHKGGLQLEVGYETHF